MSLIQRWFLPGSLVSLSQSGEAGLISASASKPVDMVLGGWNFTGDIILRSGDHLTPLYAGYDSTGTGIVTALTNSSLRPDKIGNPTLPKGQHSHTSLV